jgi:hypothetical protein
LHPAAPFAALHSARRLAGPLAPSCRFIQGVGGHSAWITSFSGGAAADGVVQLVMIILRDMFAVQQSEAVTRVVARASWAFESALL